MTRIEALVSLNTVLDIGSIRLNKLLAYFGSPQNILRASAHSLAAVSGIGEKIAAKIVALKKEDAEREFALAKKSGLKIIVEDSEEYPKNLKNIPDPPPVLYLKGELKEEDRFSFAIVGSRSASFYGLSCAEKFAYDLAQRGLTIVSGMARGIDTYAHRGALKAKGRTIAVIGSGFNHMYPAQNKELAEEIAENGAVISEFPINTRPLKQNFPRRNHLISGLGLGVLVVEAALNSGALITSNFALEQGREVFALPGKIDSVTSSGTNGLIKQGAKLVASCDDILEEFSQSVYKEEIVPRQNKTLPETRKRQALSEKESVVLSSICEQPVNFDEIIEESAFSVPETSGILLNLKIKKLIKELPGKQFVRSSQYK